MGRGWFLLGGAREGPPGLVGLDWRTSIGVIPFPWGNWTPGEFGPGWIGLAGEGLEGRANGGTRIGVKFPVLARDPLDSLQPKGGPEELKGIWVHPQQLGVPGFYSKNTFGGQTKDPGNCRTMGDISFKPPKGLKILGQEFRAGRGFHLARGTPVPPGR